jgi:uncharacterized membrane protein/uncharacterized membrane protein YbhN (UPF0104 family)
MFQINKTNVKKYLKIFFGIPLTLLSFYFIFASILKSGPQLVPRLENIHYSLLFIGSLFILVFFLLKAVAWHQILQNLGYHVPLKRSFFLLQYGETKRYIPGNIFSFAARVQYFQEFKIPSKTIIKGLAIETFLLVFSSFVVSIPALFFFSHIIFAHDTDIKSFFGTLWFKILVFLFILGVLIGGYFLNRYKERLNRNLFSWQIFRTYSNTFSLFILAWIFFGIGNYLVASSIAFLNPYFFLQFSSFLVLSWLIGYLSFITPMGLGVREAVLSIGLSQFIPFYIASAIAIMVRIVFILCDIIFFLTTLVLDRINISKHYAFLKNISLQSVILASAIVSYSIYFTYVTFQKYLNFFTGRFDLGNMDQTVWNTLHGRIFQITNPDGINIMSRLGIHADFILILFAPFYAIWSDPRMLLLIQTIVVALGAVFVYLLAKNIIQNKNLAIILSITYLLNPLVQKQNLYDFHAITLATTFLIATFYFLIKKRYGWFVIFLVLSVLTKEDIYLIAAMFGLYFFMKGKRWQGLTVTIISLVFFVLLMRVFIPGARGGPHFALSYLSNFGDSPVQIILNIIIKPQLTFFTLAKYSTIQYLFQIFAPLGFLSLFSPLYLIFASPELFINLLSTNPNLRDISYQYNAAVIPFLYISSIFAIHYLLSKKYRFFTIKTFTVYLLFWTIFTAWLYGPLPGAKNPELEIFTKQTPHRAEIFSFIQTIPKNVSIAATNNVAGALSHRQRIYVLPQGIKKANLLLFLPQDGLKGTSIEAQIARRYLQDKNFHVIYKLNNFVALERNSE